MNILPHKSWHVRRKDNIERVRRDEAKAAEEEKERLRRAALAEQEARTDLLRSKSRKRLAESSEPDEHPSVTDGKDSDDTKKIDIYGGTGGHINFFKDAEEGIAEKKKNAEHEKERKAEKEQWEKKMGILTYLGQSSTEDPTPWYLSKKKKEEKDFDSARNEKDEKRKDRLDPIHALRKYVEKSQDAHSSNKKHKHKHKDKKEKKKHKHKSKDKEKTKPTSSSSATIEQLRAERLKRESEEKKRSADLLAKLRGETVPDKQETVQMDDRQRGYNSQYNPDFVRRPKDR